MLIDCLSLSEAICLNEKLIDFEKQFVYPINNGFFRISHGEHYTHFFNTLRFNIDTPLFFIGKDDKGAILGVMVAVLQEIPSSNGYQKTWYLCDLKISPTVTSISVLVGLLSAVKERCYPICSKAYALSMNAGVLKNKILHFSMNNRFARFQGGGALSIYNVTSENDLLLSLRKNRNLYLLRSTSLKTIILNNNTIDLWHLIDIKNFKNAHFQNFKDIISVEGNKDCIKSILKNGFVLSMLSEKGNNGSAWGSCTVLHRDLNDINWDWVTSFDI